MQHLDEGTIHAWLDGALTADEAADVGRHASECAECAALVAEARGLVAGASRILSSLDDVPGVMPGAGDGGRGAAATIASIETRRRQQRRRFWSRPAAIAAAASVVLMAGSALVLKKSGGPTTLSAPRMADSGVVVRPANTEAAATAPAAGGAAGAQGATPRDGASRGAAGGTASAPAVLPRPRQDARRTTANEAPRRAIESRGAIPLSGRVATTPSRDTTMLLNEVVVTAAPAASGAAAQKAAGFEKLAPSAAAAPAPAVADRLAAQPLTAPDSGRYAAAAAEPTDTMASRRRAAASRAAARRAAAARARSERAVPTTGAEAPQSVSRVDTVYRMRTDTVTVSRIDTVIVPPPTYPALRDNQQRAAIRLRGVQSRQGILRYSGCYEVMQGALPKFVTLAGESVVSGAGDERYAARAPGASGYWGPDAGGGIRIVLAGASVVARMDAATGELRGEARRGASTERFVARPCL
jgi:putative zinc finger protein